MTTVTVREIPLDQIITDETQRQPPKTLRESLTSWEMRHPIYVRELAGDQYLLIEGSQRLAFAREAGQPTILANVRPAAHDDLPKDLEAIIINTQRHNLEQLFIARHARRLKADGYTQTRIAHLIHRSEAALSSMLAVLDCPDLVAAIEDEDLQFGSARALAALPLPDRRQLLHEIRCLIEKNGKLPSVRQVEDMVRQRQGGAPMAEITLQRLPAVLQELEDEGIPIEIQTSAGKKNKARVLITLEEAEAATLRRFLAALAPAHSSSP